MDRRRFLGSLTTLAGLPLLGVPSIWPVDLRSPGRTSPSSHAHGGAYGHAGRAGHGRRSAADPDWEPLELSEEEWREILTDAEFEILREEGTEPAGSSPLNREKREGTFICAGCFLPLFSADDKFMSGTGWPSFTRPIDESHVGTKLDFKLIWPRTEYHCARCGGHQGHIFDDGPEPTGERWCNNGAALDFVPKDEALPELRQRPEASGTRLDAAG